MKMSIEERETSVIREIEKERENPSDADDRVPCPVERVVDCIRIRENEVPDFRVEYRRDQRKFHRDPETEEERFDAPDYQEYEQQEILR